MIITGMDNFQNICRQRLVEWYNSQDFGEREPITLDDTFVVWSCKILQNYKCLASTTVPGDSIYVEYTFNGDKKELYEDVYKKIVNQAYTEDFLELTHEYSYAIKN